MKHSIRKLSRFPTAAGLIALLTGNVLAQSPVGQWNLAISGNRQGGGAIVEFSNDGSITGYEVVTATPVKSVTSPRGTTSSNPRGGGSSSGSTNSTPSNSTTNFIGTAQLSGFWITNRSGLVIGVLNQLTSVAGADGMPRQVTNGMTFTGKATSRRLTLVGNRGTIRWTYRGVLNDPVNDVDGDYYAYLKHGSVNDLHLLSLTPDGLWPNTYDVQDVGPGSLSYSGKALASPSRQLSIIMFELGTNGLPKSIVAAVSGSAQFSRGLWTLHGTDSSQASVKFTGTKLDSSISASSR